MMNQHFWAKALVPIAAVATLALLTRTAILTASLAADIVAETEFHQLIQEEAACRMRFLELRVHQHGSPEF